MKKKKVIILTLAGLLLAGGLIFMMSKKGVEDDVRFQMTEVAEGDIATNITATGTIEPVKTVDVGTQVSGIVKKLYVDYNSVVKKGQVIAELDRTNLISDLNSAQANLRTAQIELDYQKKNYARYAELKQKDLVSTSEYDVALENYRKAQENVKVAQQSVSRSKTNLGYATVYSPIDGVVISKAVEEGQTVASGFSTPTIVKIAKDLTDMQCIAKVDEADIGGVKEGQRVTFTVDAFPDDVFSGTVKQVRQSGVTTNNVVTYEVVISAPKAGMTAEEIQAIVDATNANEPDDDTTAMVESLTAVSLATLPEEVKKYEIKDVEADKKLWTLDGTVLTAHKVEVGVSDGSRTEIISGLEEGTSVIQSFIVGKETPTGKDGKDGKAKPDRKGPPQR